VIHVAGNAVLDLLLRDVPTCTGGAEDAWTPGNVRFLARPPEGVLGGNGGAAAYLLGRLGDRVSLNAQVGTDVFGKRIRAWLETEAKVDLVVPPAKTTAVNVIPISPGGERRSIYYTGEKVVWKQSLDALGADWFYASGYGQVTAEDLSELSEVLREFRRGGSQVMFDPGPWFFQAASRSQMLAAWKNVDVLVGTEQELGTWDGRGAVGDTVGGLLSLGPRAVVVKRGAEGAAFGSPDEGVGALPTDRVQGRNTVGAGDAFNAGLLHAMCRGSLLREAVAGALGLATQAVRCGRGVLGALAF